MNKEHPTRRFGTFGGVFTPNVLTILGIILFLRIGWVVGNAGLKGALLIIVLSNFITLLTGLSLSAISTNIEVKTGGSYYLISRSLGLEIGGSIGIPLYLSQAISVAFYIIGFSESIISSFPFHNLKLISSIVCIIFGIIAYIGASFAIKIQYVILSILSLSLISFFAGPVNPNIVINYTSHYTEGYTFWKVFAVFFPAVTGIMTGVSMSGDLKNPSKSIPRGTLLSIGITFLIYIFTAYRLSSNVPVNLLITDNLVMKRISLIPELILVGVWASTLSSALGSIVAAPRTLQALSLDNILPRFFSLKLGSKTEPRIGVITTFLIAIFIIQLGNLNFVATIITMFFLNTYGMVNFTAGFEKMVGNPSYRPKLKVHWIISILGAFGCYYTMFLINASATIIAIIISYGIFFLLERRSLNQVWGDVRSGIWFELSRFALLKLESTPWSPKNWRPNIMVFTGLPQYRRPLTLLAEWLSKGKGLITLFQIVTGDINSDSSKGMKEIAYKNIKQFIKENNLKAFGKVEIVKEFTEGVRVIAQSHGIGGLNPNVTLFGWSREPLKQTNLMSLVRDLVRLKKSVLILKFDEKKEFGNHKTIDIWWGGKGGNGMMMILIAYLITLNSLWRRAKIRILMVIDNPKGTDKAQANIKRLLENARLNAEVKILTRESSEQPIEEVLGKLSHNTDLTILGTAVPEKGNEEKFAKRIENMVKLTRTTLIVRSTETEDILI
ncbi:hypothetical protein DRQ09_02105, partial [candidate division KSB1 bacterium]